MVRIPPTVADLKIQKGLGQKTMLRLTTLDEARAAEEAQIDIASVPPQLLCDPSYRAVAPGLFSMTGLAQPEAVPADDYLRFCSKMLSSGADALYCSASMQTVEYLAREYVPVVGHVGLVPSRATWTGGFRAVGKTAKSAISLFRECQAYQDAGAIAVEIEVVPEQVATEISKRLDILLWSMGAGAGCDAQYLFAEDILGENRGQMPRHARAYRSFAADYDRLQSERVSAFLEFREDVARGSFPGSNNIVQMDPREHEAFLDGIGG